MLIKFPILKAKQAIESAATTQTARADPTAERELRKPKIFSDAILVMLKAPVGVVNGLLDTDEDFLRNHAGVTDFSEYSLIEGATPRRIMQEKFPDLTVAQ